MDVEEPAERTLVAMEEGQLINDWKIVQHIGSGGYGNVYHVERRGHGGEKLSGAMKVERVTKDTANQVLKIEAQLLRNMARAKKKDVLMLYASGKRNDFQYIVMTLVGPDLTNLVNSCGGSFSASTTLLVALRGMYALKQMHDVGYVHRDVKPCNFATSFTNPHVIMLVDYGLTRRFADYETDAHGEHKWKIIPARKKISFRGTMCYCSTNMHLRKEQGRHDDLISLLYVCMDLYFGLPWARMPDAHKLEQMKLTITDEELCEPTEMKNPCTKSFIPLMKHLRKIEYFDRPSYSWMFQEIHKEMTTHGFKLTDQFDWDQLPTKTSKEKEDKRSREKSISVEKEEEEIPEMTAMDPDDKDNHHPPHAMPSVEDFGTGTGKGTDKHKGPKGGSAEAEHTNFGKGVDHAAVLHAEFDSVGVPGGVKYVDIKRRGKKKSRE